MDFPQEALLQRLEEQDKRIEEQTRSLLFVLNDIVKKLDTLNDTLEDVVITFGNIIPTVRKP